jgi:ubiquinone/menaquinone biosynthesis C-methylase UbiE
VNVRDWWQEMFELPPWQAVQLGWESLEDTDHQVDQIVRATGLEPGMRVLDVPCGTGRIARRLAKRGIDVVGVDITERFLEEARATGLAVEKADMRELPFFDEEFDVVVCMWGSFGYFDRPGDLAQARAAHRALKAGGRYLIDTHCLETLLPIFSDQGWFEGGDVYALQRRTYVPGTGRVETEWTFLRNGERHVQRTSIRVYSLRELTDLLSEAGFSGFAPLDDELEPLAIGSHRLWLVATK